MNVAKVYDPIANVEKENEEATPPSTLTERSSTLSSFSKCEEKYKAEKKKEASHSPRSSLKKGGSSKCTSEDYKVVLRNNGGKSVNLLRRVDTHFTTVEDFNTWRFDK